jgi:hypothetical protein
MARGIAFKCKTTGCSAWFPVREMPNDTPRKMNIVLRLPEATKRLKCPECGQAHDYFPADKKEIQTD